MMEGIWLGVWCLSGWLILPACPLRHYYFVNKPLTWNEAQNYCRQKYTDLATAENTEDMMELESLLSSSNQNSDVWFGLYGDIDWKWSDGFTGSGAEYRNWSRGPIFTMNKFCVYNYIHWYNRGCESEIKFVCYNGTQENRQFVGVHKYMNWTDAQKYCRENFVDLATITNDNENLQLLEVMWGKGFAWIGLFKDPDFYWSDGSGFSWSNFGDFSTPMGSLSVLCGSTSLQRSMKWKLLKCKERLPFVCHGVPVTRQVVKLRIDLEDSSVDPHNPAVKEELLTKLQARLKENGVSGVTLKWTEQPDGKVFHKEVTEGTPPA